MENVLDRWKKALDEKKETIVLTDKKMDLNLAAFNSRYNVSGIENMTYDFLKLLSFASCGS